MPSAMARTARRLLLLLAGVLGLAAVFAGPASAQQAVSRDEAIEQLAEVRASIDRTLSLIKAGRAEQAFAEAREGYLTHFEAVEVPLRVADNELTITAEGRFAEIRQAIRSGESVESVRSLIIDLRGLIDDAERKLTAMGVAGPALVTGQSFLILFREGFEVVLLVSVLLGYLEAARSLHFVRPILVGIGLAAVATVLTVFALRVVFAALPVPLELLEAITALVAVVMLFYVSFWLIARMEHKRWMEFVKARLWSAISLGSTASLVLVGFTAVYREGFETALFYQSLLSFGEGLHLYVLLGIGLALLALAAVAFALFRLGRKLPVKTFMNVAVVLVMATSVAFLGNAMHALQAADIVGYHRLTSWWHPPIFLSQATGYWPTLETVVAQCVLAGIYVLGGVYTFVVRPRLLARRATRAAVGSPALAGGRALPA
ncbi:MAG: FTR1 family protein [Acidimicrobiales bacterium]